LGALGQQIFAIKARVKAIWPSVYQLEETMKTFVFISLIVAVAVAAPPKSSDDVSVLSRKFSNDGNNYEFAFEQSDGQTREEQGEIKVSEIV
jgi:hypothetical protein